MQWAGRVMGRKARRTGWLARWRLRRLRSPGPERPRRDVREGGVVGRRRGRPGAPKAARWVLAVDEAVAVIVEPIGAACLADLLLPAHGECRHRRWAWGRDKTAV